MGAAALEHEIRDLARRTGIDVVGFAAATEFKDYALPDSKRRNPALTLASARTVIVAGIYIGGLTLPVWDDPEYGRTSRLFLSGHFSDVVQPLQPIATLLREQGYRAYICDSSNADGSIVPLKLAAIRAGIGWQGKHSLLISRRFGTFLTLGGVVTDAALEANTEPEPDRCGKCEQCRQACPMAALEQPYCLDRTKCLSSLLMSDEIPPQADAVLGNRVMDCEICQQACPWNFKHLRKPLATGLTRSFQSKVPEWEAFFRFENLAELDEATYTRTIEPLNTGIPYTVFMRNVRLAQKRRSILS